MSEVKFIKVEPFRSSTMHGVLNEFKIIESDNPLFIGFIIFIQNVNKKTYIGWGYDKKQDYCNSIDEFKNKYKIGEVEFVKR